MKNQFQQGDAIDIVAPSGGTVSGNGYLIGAALFGIASNTVAAGATVALWVRGVFTMTKPVGENWAVGDIIYWSPTNKYATKTNSSSDRTIGVCVQAVTGTTSGVVRLTPG